MILSDVVAQACANPKEKEVAEKLICLAGRFDNDPFGAYLFEKASLKMIQKLIFNDDERLNIMNFRMFLLNDLKNKPGTVENCRNYAKMFDLNLTDEEIRELDIADILSQGLPALQKG